jgi:hypothetical protein
MTPVPALAPDPLTEYPVPDVDREAADRARNIEFITRVVPVEDREGLVEGDEVCSCGAWRPAAQNGCECGQFVYWHRSEMTLPTGVKGRSAFVVTNPEHPDR